MHYLLCFPYIMPILLLIALLLNFLQINQFVSASYSCQDPDNPWSLELSSLPSFKNWPLQCPVVRRIRCLVSGGPGLRGTGLETQRGQWFFASFNSLVFCLVLPEKRMNSFGNKSPSLTHTKKSYASCLLGIYLNSFLEVLDLFSKGHAFLQSQL